MLKESVLGVLDSVSFLFVMFYEGCLPNLTSTIKRRRALASSNTPQPLSTCLADYSLLCRKEIHKLAHFTDQFPVSTGCIGF